MYEETLLTMEPTPPPVVFNVFINARPIPVSVGRLMNLKIYKMV
jgi:hypothetical protein